MFPKKLFLILLVGIITLSISFSSKAEIVHCCQWTNNNNFCVESTDIEFRDFGGCKAGYKSTYSSCSNNVDQCKLGTCIPSGKGECLAQKYKVECTQNNQGRWVSQDIRSVNECQIGCCNVGGSVCSLQEKKVCVQDLANGDQNAFNAAIVNSVECDNSCRGADFGTCKTENGCRYVNRRDCSGEFFTNKYPREVIGCFVTSHSFKSCGDGTSDNDKFNVYWFDSNNNREEIVEECSYPDEICNDPDGKAGQEGKCISTKCVESCPDCYPGQFKSGESVCLNVLGGHFENEQRSTGLSNYILHCQWGVVETDNIDENRDKRCEESYGMDGTFNAKWRSNNWQECSQCGEGAIEKADYLGFAPVFGYPLVSAFGNACSEHGRLDYDKCSDFGNGDCGSLFSSNAYDGDFIWPPIGSCNPKYPPGEGSINYGDPVNRCKQCGQGGDKATNQCTREECNAIGDCYFESSIKPGLGSTAALGLGTCASAAATAYFMQFLPFIGQATVLGAMATCGGIGSNSLYWGLIGTVYTVGGSVGSEIGEYQLSQEVITNGKAKLGPVFVLSKSSMENISKSNIDNIKTLNAEERSLLVKNLAIYSGASYIMPPIAGGLLTVFSERFTRENLKNAFSRNLIPQYQNLYGRYTDEQFDIISSGLNRKLTKEEKKIVKELLKSDKEVISDSLARSANYVGLATEFITVAKSFDTGQCLPEISKGYTDNSRCDLCGSGEGQWYCTEERCNLLGGKRNDDPQSGHCLYIPYNITGTKDGLCISREQSDSSVPTITKVNVKLFDNIGNQINEFSATSKSLDIAQLLSWNVHTVKISIDTNERADCRYSNEIGKLYDESSGFGDMAYPTTHVTEINMTENEKIGSVTYYFKCMDVNGNKIDKADDSNFLKIKFDKRPDTSAPVIQSLDPRNVYLPERIKSIKISLLVYDENDVASCKFSRDKVNYDDMEVNLDRAADKSVCVDTTVSDCREFSTNYNLVDGQNISVEGYENNITVYPIIIKCKDTLGNLMIEPYNTSIFVIPTFKLAINQPIENEKVWDRTPFINATSGTVAFCNYTIDDKEFTFGTASFDHLKEHTEDLSAGQHVLKVKCNDYAKNEATAIRNFEVAYDNKVPFVTSIFKDDRKLCIKVDESAECRYSFDDIFPDGWEIGNQMVNSQEAHCSQLKEGEVYYIMCMDSWINNATFSVFP